MTTEAEHFPLVDENGRRYRLTPGGNRVRLLVQPEPFGPVDDDPRAPLLLVRGRCGANGGACGTELVRVYLTTPETVTVRTVSQIRHTVIAADGTREPADRHRLASEDVIPAAELCDWQWNPLCDGHGERDLDGARLAEACRHAVTCRAAGAGPGRIMLADPAPGE